MCFLMLLFRIQDIWGSTPGPEDSTPLEVWPSALSSTRQALSQYFKTCRGLPSSCFLTPRYLHSPPPHSTLQSIIVYWSSLNTRRNKGSELSIPFFWLMTNLKHSFWMYLFYASTRFEQQVLIIRRAKLY
jgi:hypothetical protein